MDQAFWTRIDQYLVDTLLPADAALEQALVDSNDAGLPPIAVAPNQGKLLHLLVKISGARRVLEVGTLGGYSTIWMARALPADGLLVTLELSEHHAHVARINLARAGLAAPIDLRVGPASDSLAKLVAEKPAPFDFFFLDADKPGNPAYFEAALRLSRPGSVIVIDNVVRAGHVADPDSTDPSVLGVRRLHEMIAREPRVTATAVQTVGSKGHDGFTIVRVND